MSSAIPVIGNPALYGPTLFWAAAIALEVVLTGVLVGSARKRTGVPYPCMTGCSDYTESKRKGKLSEAQWLDFANAQRAHYNFVEGAASILTVLLVAGLFHPTTAGYLGATYFVGRALYAYGYVASGPKGRLPGVILVDIALLGLSGMALHGSAKLSGWI